MSMAGTMIDTAAAVRNRPGAARRTASFLAKHPAILIGGAMLLLFVVVALLAPLVLPDPVRLNPLQRLRSGLSRTGSGSTPSAPINSDAQRCRGR
jgi:hypothetical protein